MLEGHAGGSCDPAPARPETRLTLTTTSDPQDAARPDTDEVPVEEVSVDAEQTTAPEDAPQPATEPEDAQAPPPEEEKAEPGVGEAIGGVRAAAMRMLDAHIALLRAELQITGKELGIIAGLAGGALVITMLVLGLLYVGGFLFIGEWLFGSMGWGIIHGTLVGVAFIGLAGINLAGGDVRAYAGGAAIGVGVTVVLAALLLSNVGNEGGEAVSRWFREELVPDSDLPFGSEWVTTLGGLAIGAIIGGVVALIANWRAQFDHPFGLLLTGLAAGGFVGAIYVSTRYDAVDGVMGMTIMIGLLTWVVAGIVLAVRRGFDPEARYANLVPRESLAAFESTKAFVSTEFERQKNRMMGR
jgi:hypothetical protein